MTCYYEYRFEHADEPEQNTESIVTTDEIPPAYRPIVDADDFCELVVSWNLEKRWAL